nr:hypothetical protein [Desulfovibrio inopinatus]
MDTEKFKTILADFAELTLSQRGLRFRPCKMQVLLMAFLMWITIMADALLSAHIVNPWIFGVGGLKKGCSVFVVKNASILSTLLLGRHWLTSNGVTPGCLIAKP